MSPGYIEITGTTLNHVLNRLVRSRSELEAASIELHEGYFSLEIHVRKVVRAEVRASFSVQEVNLREPPRRLRLRRRGRTELGGASFLTDLIFRAAGDPLRRLVGWVSFLRLQDDVLDVNLEDSPFARHLDRPYGGFTPGEWLPLRSVQCRPGAVRLVLDVDEP